MYLSDRDLQWAIAKGELIVNPPPERIQPTSFDLHLGPIDTAQVWDMDKLIAAQKTHGHRPGELPLGKFDFRTFSEQYLAAPPKWVDGDDCPKVSRRGDQIIVKPHGFLLWTTKEEVGTPEGQAHYICFVDGKSTRARTGILVHLTAPTIHAAWSGVITLEIANLGPLTFVLEENDVIAQITVAMISSVPERTHAEAGSATIGQVDPRGKPLSPQPG